MGAESQPVLFTSSPNDIRPSFLFSMLGKELLGELTFVRVVFGVPADGGKWKAGDREPLLKLMLIIFYFRFLAAKFVENPGKR